MPAKHTDPDQPSIEELEEVSIHQELSYHKVQVSIWLRPDLHLALIDFFRHHYDCFAWFYTDITGIDPEVTIHQLYVYLDCPLIKPKRHKFTP